MSALTKDLTPQELVQDIPHVLTFLLIRFERDAGSLSDYLLPEEQKKWLGHVEYAIRNHLLVERRWPNAEAGALAREYRGTLAMRLARPGYFRAKGFHPHSD